VHSIPQFLAFKTPHRTLYFAAFISFCVVRCAALRIARCRRVGATIANALAVLPRVCLPSVLLHHAPSRYFLPLAAGARCCILSLQRTTFCTFATRRCRSLPRSANVDHSGLSHRIRSAHVWIYLFRSLSFSGAQRRSLPTAARFFDYGGWTERLGVCLFLRLGLTPREFRLCFVLCVASLIHFILQLFSNG